MEDIAKRVQGNDGRMNLPTLTISAAVGWMNQLDRFYGNIAGKEQQNYTLLHRGDLSYNHGNSKLAKYGTVFSLHSYEEALVPRVYHSFRMINCSADFIEYYFAARLMDKELSKLISSGARMDGLLNISYDEFVGMTMKLPSIEEQNKIAGYFRKVDSLITLHQRKLNKLKKVKKSMLEKMFPQNGEKKPQIRFCGFNSTWEQRKFGEIFEEYSEKKHDELPLLTIIQGGGTIPRDESNRNLQYDKTSLSNYKMVKKDDFIVHLRSFEGGLEKANSDGIISPAYHTFHGENTDSRFYYPFFRSKRFIEVLLKPHIYGIRDGKSIDIEGMKNINLPVPSYEEQFKVGEYIEQIEHLITLHQRKLEKLKKMKKAMLEKMFV